MATTTFTTAQLAAFWGPARVNDGVANSARFALHSKNATAHFYITGTDAILKCGGGGSTPFDVSVDGGAFSNPTISGGQITIFSGLSDAAHLVDIRLNNAYSGGNGWLTRPNCLDVTGAVPAIAADPNFGPWEHTATTTLGEQNLGTITSNGYSSPASGFDRGAESYSRRGKAERIYVWSGVGGATSGFSLLIDGVYQSMTSIPSSGADGWRLLASGLDSSTEHEYTIVASKLSPSATTIYFDAVMFGGSGAELSANAVTEKKTIAVWGDSITQHTSPSCGSYGMGNGWVARLQRALDVRVHNRGVAGNTVSNVNTRLAGELSAIVAVKEPDIIIHNIGFNDTGNDTFKTNYRTMVDSTVSGTTDSLIICLPPWGQADSGNHATRIAAVVSEVANPRVVFMSAATMPAQTTASGNCCDNVHPTDTGAQNWADWMAPLLEPYIDPPPSGGGKATHYYKQMMAGV